LRPALQSPEKVGWERFVSGHDFSRADKLFTLCHPERASQFAEKGTKTVISTQVGVNFAS